jgi:hypothetical protein
MSVRGNLVLAAALLCFALFGYNWITVRSVVAPEVAKQSDFLRIYDPVPLLVSYRAPCSPWGGATKGMSAKPGSKVPWDVRNVTFTRTARIDLCDEDRYPQVEAIMHRTLLRALRFYGCEVSSDDFPEGPNPRIMYHCGTRTSGVITAGQPSRFLLLQIDEEWSVR